MQAERVRKLAEGQAAQWNQFNETSSTATGSHERSAVGAYWPLTSQLPLHSGLSAQVEVLFIGSDERFLTLSIRERDNDEPWSVLVDLGNVDDDESLDLVESLIFARVAEFVSSSRWDGRVGHVTLTV